MKKKILSLVLVVAMLASMLVFAPVSGATDTAVAVSTTDAVGVVGQTVSVDVVLLSNTPLFGIQLGYEYDSTMLHLDSVTWGVAGGSGDYSNKLNSDFNCAQGPLDVMIQCYADTFDAADGLVIATLNFTALKEGSSKVAIRDFNDVMGDSVNYAYTSQDYSVYFTGSEIACAEASNVTVFPADYLAGEAIPESEWLFDEGYIYGVESALAAVTGTVVVPSEIGGVAVEGIDYGTFDACALSTVIIPETVSFIGGGAFNDCVNLTSVYVYNATTEFDVHAIGYINGTMGRRGYNEDGVRSSTDVMIYGAAGSTAEAYAAANNCSFSADSLPYTLSVNGSTFFVPAETTAPDVVETNDGKVVVGWNDGAKTYIPGEAMTLTGDTTLTPVTIDAIKMNTGVGFKMGAEIDKCQMRFTTDMTVADYNTLASLGTVTVGTLITPAAYVSLAGGFTFEALDALSTANGGVPTYINVPAGGYFKINQEETVYTFAGSLAGFKNENIDLAYAAAFYATVTIDEETSFTVYSAFDLSANRTVNSAITAMTGVSAAEYGLTTLEAKTLRDLIAAN